MGTNFYILKGKSSEGRHIGKRSAAGYYCWNCGITLCTTGNDKIHKSDSEFYKECPNCGSKPKRETMKTSAAGLELGFNSKLGKKVDVRSCSSFNWATDPGFLLTNPPAKVIDEYGAIMDWADFRDVLDGCPVWFTQSVGRNFS